MNQFEKQLHTEFKKLQKEGVPHAHRLSRARSNIESYMEMRPPTPTTPHHFLYRPYSAITTALFAILFCGGSVVYAAWDSLPGDTLYPVKLATEKVVLAIQPNDAARTELHMAYAEKRVDELETVTRIQEDVQRELVRTVENLEAHTEEVTEFVDTRSALTEKANAALEAESFTHKQQERINNAEKTAPKEVAPIVNRARLTSEAQHETSVRNLRSTHELLEADTQKDSDIARTVSARLDAIAESEEITKDTAPVVIAKDPAVLPADSSSGQVTTAPTAPTTGSGISAPVASVVQPATTEPAAVATTSTKSVASTTASSTADVASSTDDDTTNATTTPSGGDTDSTTTEEDDEDTESQNGEGADADKTGSEDTTALPAASTTPSVRNIQPHSTQATLP